MLKPGIYVAESGDHYLDYYKITMEVKESEKSYIFRLVELKSRYSADHIKMLFKSSERAVISKSKGGYYKKSDAQLIRDTFSRHEAEREAAIAEDKTGEGFIYEMFLYELHNHEYGYTMDTEDTLDALGYTADEVLSDPRLKRGIEKAVTEICKRG